MSEERSIYSRGNQLLKPLQEHKKKYESLFDFKVDTSEQFVQMNKLLGTLNDHLQNFKSSQSPQKKRRKMLGDKILPGDADSDGIEESFQEGEPRFKELNFRIPNVVNLPPDNKENEFKIFVSDITRKIMSEGFKYFENGELTDRKMRQFFCNNVVSNIVRFCNCNSFSKEEMRILDEHLKKKVLPFLKQRYPQNESSESNRKFESLITQVDNFDSNSNDLIYPSSIPFTWRESADYSDKIMSFINYLLRLTRETDSEGITLGQQFEKDMEEIFSKVEDETFMVFAKGREFAKWEEIKGEGGERGFVEGLLGYGREEPKKEKLKELDQVRIEAEKEKYKQKVKLYTKYAIGKKIADNFPEFSNKDIQDYNLTVRDSGIMRILTKWCEELEKCFEEANINSKDERFRMADGTERYIKKSERQELYIEMQDQEEIVYDFLQRVKDNIYSNQHEILKSEKWLPKFRTFCSEAEATTGYFATIMKKSYENYLISYLNKLIHCVLSAQEGLKSRHSKKDHYKIAVNLISFKIGDLLRCKCSSREDEIIAIYNYLVYLCEKNPEKYDIVRVKNRLSEGTKDILINFKYKSKILVEMQLSIDEEASHFIKCSDKANHFIYELERSTFGPLLELCNVYYSVDPRANFFGKKFEEMNNQIVPRKSIAFEDHICSDKTKAKLSDEFKTSLPVWCSICDLFSFSLNIPDKHIRCKKCDFAICSRCNFMKSNFANTLNFAELTKTGKTLKDSIKKKIMVQEFTKKKQTSEIYLVYFNFKLMFFELSEENSRIVLNLVGETKKEKEFKQIVSKWEIIKSTPVDSSEFKKLEEPLNNALIKMTVKNVNKKLRKYFVFEEQKIDENILVGYEMPTVETLNMKKTNLTNINIIIKAFPKARFVLIHKNKISSLEGIEKWPQIEELNLEGNLLKSIPEEIKNLKKLSFLLITNNKFEEFPKELCELKSLEILNFKENKVPKVHDDVEKLVNLKSFRMASNLITYLPESFSNLKKLEEIDLSSNKIEKMPHQFTKLPALRFLNLNSNSISSIPSDFFTFLPNLQKLSLSNNEISEFPLSLEQCPKIESLDFDSNLIVEIPKFLFEHSVLEELILGNNKIVTITFPQKITNSNIKILSLNKNNIKTLPEQIIILSKLEKIKLSQNFGITNLDKILGQFPQLKEASISGLGLEQFPEKICQMSGVEAISCDDNKIARLDSLGVLGRNLKELYLSKNLLSQFPEVLLQCENLENLGLNKNHIKVIPNLKALKSLEKLKLEENPLEKFEELSEDLNNLTSLYVSEDKIHLIQGKLAVTELLAGKIRYIGPEENDKS